MHAMLKIMLNEYTPLEESVPCPGGTVALHPFVCAQLDDLWTEFFSQKSDINTLYANPGQLRNTHKYFVMNSRSVRTQ